MYKEYQKKIKKYVLEFRKEKRRSLDKFNQQTKWIEIS